MICKYFIPEVYKAKSEMSSSSKPLNFRTCELSVEAYAMRRPSAELGSLSEKAVAGPPAWNLRPERISQGCRAVNIVKTTEQYNLKG